MGEYEKASEIYMIIAEKLLADGYDEEAEMAKEESKRILSKINS